MMSRVSGSIATGPRGLSHSIPLTAAIRLAPSAFADGLLERLVDEVHAVGGSPGHDPDEVAGAPAQKGGDEDLRAPRPLEFSRLAGESGSAATISFLTEELQRRLLCRPVRPLDREQAQQVQQSRRAAQGKDAVVAYSGNPCALGSIPIQPAPDRPMPSRARPCPLTRSPSAATSRAGARRDRPGRQAARQQLRLGRLQARRRCRTGEACRPE